jgi:outer membrane lipoprotein SlyB
MRESKLARAQRFERCARRMMTGSTPHDEKPVMHKTLTPFLACVLLAAAGVANATDAETRKRAEEWYERDKAICAEDQDATRRMQCMRDARTVYENSIAGTAPAASGAAPSATASAPACTDCGTISAIREVEQKGEGTGLGAIAGGVLGGVLGHQIGHGTGKTIATVGGAAGGAYAGHQIEKSARSTNTWNVTIRMDNGTDRTIALDTAPSLAVGDRVRVEGNNIIRQ